MAANPMTEYRMPGYTGYVPGINETYKRTPVAAQAEIRSPGPDSFIYTRECAMPSSFPPARDPKTHTTPLEADILWPALQTTSHRESLKPPVEPMVLGDMRLDVFRTSHAQDFKAPFAGMERLRSPNRNDDLAATTVCLKDVYASAYNRVGEARLAKIISTMRERLAAKVGSQNNAFKFRKLFAAYDKDKTGRVQVEDFRNMAEQFGMQLDDDSLLALFNRYDPEGTGFVTYLEIVKELMDEDCYALYVNTVDVSAAKAVEDRTLAQLASLQKKFAPMTEDLESVLRALDSSKGGVLSLQDMTAGCASLGLILGESEISAIANFDIHGESHHGGAIIAEDGAGVYYHNFIHLLKAGPSCVTKRTRQARDSASRRPTHLTVGTGSGPLSPGALTSPTGSPAPKRTHK